MGKLGPVFRQIIDAGEIVARRANDKLPGMPQQHSRQMRNFIEQIRDKDNYDGKPSRTNVSEKKPDVQHIPVHMKPFKRNRKHDAQEYDRQYNEQIETLQNMPVSQWRRNRQEYLANGRTSDSLRAQDVARDAAFKDEYKRLRQSGLSAAEAREQARDWLKTQAATHRLDGIAGGDVTDISGVGDSRINSSLGSQWRSRVGDIDAAVDAFVKKNPDVDLDHVYMNILFR